MSLIPIPSYSDSIILLCVNGLTASNTTKIILQVLATLLTCLPLPIPSLIPSIIPGKSENCIYYLYINQTPGINAKVVNSLSYTSENLLVFIFNKVLFLQKESQ